MSHSLHATATPLLVDYLIDSARRLPDKTAVVAKKQSITYGELLTRAGQLAGHLAEHGVVRGDRVLIYGDNSVEAVISFWAIQLANAIPSVINPLTKAKKLTYLLNDCRAKALITDGRLRREFMAAIAESNHLALVIVNDPFDDAALASAAAIRETTKVVRFNDACVDTAVPPERKTIDIDVAAIIYTSGSTGEPKGTMLTHRGMRTAATSVSTLLEMAEDDVVVSPLPLAFNYGLYQMILSFRLGAKVVLAPSFTYPAQVIKVMHEQKMTGFPGVPTVFALFIGLKKAREYDWSHVRFITNTAASLPEKHIRELKAIFPNARIYSMYGLTECKRCTYLPYQDIERKPGSVGIAIPNTEMWIVDEHDQRVGPGVVGQLVIRGGTVMIGYWGKPEATKKALRPGPVPGENVFYTGDLCRMDDEGYLYFVSRMDDIIKSRGEKVPPKEVETALMEMDGIREAAVIGVPDEILGEAIKAFVVLEDDATLVPDEIRRTCRLNLEAYMVPGEIVIVSSLPKTTTGKIKRNDLR